MMRPLTIVAFALTAMLSFGSAVAESMVEGTVTKIDLNSRGIGLLTIRDEGTDALRTFEVTPDTEFTLEYDKPASRITRYIDIDPNELKVGDEVQLDVADEVDGKMAVVRYRRVPVIVQTETRVAQAQPRPQTRNNRTAANTTSEVEAQYRYDSLPDTATPLPLIALFGALTLLSAGGIRLSRKS